MKARQFKQLAGLSRPRRAALVVEGLEAIAASVTALACEMERCSAAGARRASQLVSNVGTEEAGKFLILLDVYRSPRSEGATISRQFARAQIHLPKLVYAQIADYSIGSRHELVQALGHLRPSHHLNGPNDYDWIVRNQLIMEQEGPRYVDLIESDSELQWWTPRDPGIAGSVSRPMRLVQAIAATGLLSAAGLSVLEHAWDDFDAAEASACWDWAGRTAYALDQLGRQGLMTADAGTAAFVCDRWPMPMVELEVEEERVEVSTLESERDAQYAAFMMRELGFDQ